MVTTENTTDARFADAVERIWKRQEVSWAGSVWKIDVAPVSVRRRLLRDGALTMTEWRSGDPTQEQIAEALVRESGL